MRYRPVASGRIEDAGPGRTRIRGSSGVPRRVAAWFAAGWVGILALPAVIGWVAWRAASTEELVFSLAGGAALTVVWLGQQAVLAWCLLRPDHRGLVDKLRRVVTTAPRTR
jgi:hypothetical protein